MSDQTTSASPPLLLRAMQTQQSRAYALAGIDLAHSGVTIKRFIAMHMLGAIFPITAGVMLFGWRGAGAIIFVVGSAALATLLWRSIGLRGHRLRLDHVLWMALLLALMLPAHLASSADATLGTRVAPWPILCIAGLVLVIFMWILGGAGSGRIHPVLIAHLMLFVMFGDFLSPQLALRRDRAFVGDLLNASDGPPAPPRAGRRKSAPEEPLITEQVRVPWISGEPDNTRFDAVRSVPAAQRLESYTGGHTAPERLRISLQALVRDRLPPLEDLIVGGQPAPIGQGSAIAVIIGGLFLLYRGLIDYRVPLLIFLSAFVMLLVLPVPIVITDTEPIMRWFAWRDPSVGTSLGVTFANYEVMASPLLFMGFFLATAPAVRPLTRRARVIYATLVGVAAAAFQIYVSASIGPYLALLGISLLSPTLDRMFKPKPVV